MDDNPRKVRLDPLAIDVPKVRRVRVVSVVRDKELSCMDLIEGKQNKQGLRRSFGTPHERIEAK